MNAFLTGMVTFCVSAASCLADSPIPAPPAPPKLSMIEAIELVTKHLNNDVEPDHYYLSKIELIESSMIPAPMGSARHWVVTGTKHREKMKNQLILYLDMEGNISATPPAREKSPGHKSEDAN